MISDKQSRIVYLAFPGMGKTTYAKTHKNVMDLDFGYFRSAMIKFPKYADASNIRVLNAWCREPFVRLCSKYLDDGWIVLTNEPSLAPLLKQRGYQVVIEVPSDVDDLIQRVELRDGKNSAFVAALRSNASQWIEGWINTARKYQLPLVKGKYFKEVNMPYEQKSN